MLAILERINMNSILNNIWVTSIICSLIATMIAFFLRQLISTIRHTKIIDEANQLVVNQLKVYIINHGIPSETILNSLIKHAERKYKIRKSELLSSMDYFEEIVPEIIGNTYLKIEEQSKYLKIIDEYLVNHSDFYNDKKAKGSINNENKKFSIINSCIVNYILFFLFFMFIVKIISEYILMGKDEMFKQFLLNDETGGAGIIFLIGIISFLGFLFALIYFVSLKIKDTVIYLIKEWRNRIH